MNYVNGKIIGDDERVRVLDNIGDMLINTLRKPPPDADAVINACDRLSEDADILETLHKMPGPGTNPVLADMYIRQIRRMYNARAIRERMRIELGADYDKPRELICLHSGARAVQTVAPLGVLFHAIDGNADGLPLFGLLDGLLTGNINIVNLPAEGAGITVALLDALTDAEPALAEYIYIFDFSPGDARAMKKLAAVADAIIVRGGGGSGGGGGVSGGGMAGAVRASAAPNANIIEWGQKTSFAYATKDGVNKGALEKLALNVCLTNQLLNSSCQGVFLDTGDMEEVYNFCEEILPVLEEVSQSYPFAGDENEKLRVRAKITLDIYNQHIEGRGGGVRIFKGKSCGVAACTDSRPEPSIMYGNIWVKPLPRENILDLRRHKGCLQTAGLICADHEYAELSRSLLRAGISKVSDGFEMSGYAFGEAHNGVYPLRRFTRLVSVQNPG